MPGLVPGIHVLLISSNEDVDGRDKPGHDGVSYSAAIARLPNGNSSRCHTSTSASASASISASS
jgi:hypothetical protein